MNRLIVSAGNMNRNFRRCYCTLLLALGFCALGFEALGEQVFPLLSEAKRVHGELVSVDFIHRTGNFRADDGALMDFTMPSYAIMRYRGVEADLREVPLGTKMEFLLLPDGEGEMTRLVTTDDGQSADAEQLRKFREFTEKRGVPGWIDKTEGNTVKLTFFSADPKAFHAAYDDLLAVGKEARLCVANDELRTWNPGVDGERGSIVEVNQVPAECFGSSGVQVTLKVSNMLEGFRRGRVVRVFLSGWKAQDQFYGESLMGYGFGRLLTADLKENPAKEYPEQFPFRTDFSNAHLAWYRLEEGVIPPQFSEHVVYAELLKADPVGLTGQLQIERSSEVVDFKLIDKAMVKCRGVESSLASIPVGHRYRFHLFQDDKGAFTRVGLVSDEFSYADSQAVSFRILRMQLERGRIEVAHQMPLVKDYNGDMQQPEDIAQSLLLVTPATRVWKGAAQVKLVDLKVGDLVRFNCTAEQVGLPTHCTDLWVGEDTFSLVKDTQKSVVKAK